jgi:hypothetical protein
MPRLGSRENPIVLGTSARMVHLMFVGYDCFFSGVDKIQPNLFWTMVKFVGSARTVDVSTGALLFWVDV